MVMYQTVREPDQAKIRAKQELIAAIERCISHVTSEKSKLQETLKMIDHLAHGSVTGAYGRLTGECQRGIQATQSALNRLNTALNAARRLDTTKEVTVANGQY